MVLATLQIYQKYITTDAKGQSVWVVKLQKALYGMLESALLFYKKLLINLLTNGFMINPYDLCIMTKIICSKQMIICWHIDNLKVSHWRKVEVRKIEHWKRVFKETSALPSVLHTRYFLEAKVYQVKDNIMYQDNKSSITLEKIRKHPAQKGQST